MADANFKPDALEREKLLAALSTAYENPEHLRVVLSPRFGQIASNVNFNGGSNAAAFQTLERVDVDGVDWVEFLRVVRQNRSDSARLSVIVVQILLGGSLAGLHGTLEQIIGLGGAEREAFEACRPKYADSIVRQTRPPEDEGKRVVWYAERLVETGRLTGLGAIPLLWFVELIRRSVEPANAATAVKLSKWIETTAGLISVDENDRKQILDITQQGAPRPVPVPAPAASTNGERVLLFQVRPARDVAGTQQQFGLKAWLMMPDGSAPMSVWFSKEPWERLRVIRLLSGRSANDLAKENVDEQSPFDAVRDVLADEGIHYSDVRFELVIPFSLVWNESDQSPIVDDDGIGQTILGAAHVLTVRVWDRQRRLRSSMRREIQDLLTTRMAAQCWLVRDELPVDDPACAPAPADALKFLWVDQSGPFGNELTTRLTQGGFLGCIVGLHPTDLTVQGWAEFLQSITRAHVPITIWSRKFPPDRARLWTCFRELLHTRPLGDWAKEVFIQRRQAHDLRNGDWHLGCGLSLLWEDPRRLPPDIHSYRAEIPT